MKKTLLVLVCIVIAAGVQLVFDPQAHAATVRPGSVTFSRAEAYTIAGKREYFSIAAGACAVLPKQYAIPCAALSGASATFIGKKFAYARAYGCGVRMNFGWLPFAPYWSLTSTRVVHCPWQDATGNGGGSW